MFEDQDKFEEFVEYLDNDFQATEEKIEFIPKPYDFQNQIMSLINKEEVYKGFSKLTSMFNNLDCIVSEYISKNIGQLINNQPMDLITKNTKKKNNIKTFKLYDPSLKKNPA